MATAVRTRERRPRDAGMAGSRFIFNDHIRIPPNVTDFESFRRWCQSDDYPERGNVFWLGDTIWVDDEMEDIPTHNLVKAELYRCLGNLVKEGNLGFMFPDRARFVHEESLLSVEPDLIFVARASIRDGKVELKPNKKRRILEVRGSPDMVLEVASDSSRAKDDELLDLYFAAGVVEYWRVDARAEPIKFDILRRGPKGFTSVPRRNGRVKSAVFGRTFELLVRTGPIGIPEFTLEVAD